jgi:putative PIN family toxin of toxin-antitoxin system
MIGMAEPKPEPTGAVARPEGEAVPRIVLDTDGLIAAAYAAASASRHVLEACLRRDVQAVISPALQREYQYILSRAVRGRDFSDLFRRFLDQAEVVVPVETPRVVPDDPDDDKLVAAAQAGAADAIVTNDRHLLGLDPYGRLRILRPAAFVAWWRERGRAEPRP